MNHKINSLSTQITISKMVSNMTKYTVDPDGYQRWFLNGKLHRTDGPAIIHPNGTQSWWINGNLHREFGPAVIYPNGSKQWYLNGIQYEPQDKFNTNHNIKDGF